MFRILPSKKDGHGPEDSMSTLQTTIQSLSSEFARNILTAMRSASFEDILEETTKTNGHASPAIVKPALVAVAAKKTASAPAPAKKSASAAASSDKRIRRTAEDIEETIDQIVTLLQKNPEGLRSEAIREELGIERKFLPKPLAEALAAKRITKSGEKRATVYKVRPSKGKPAITESEEAAN
jgi:hypothetical protein